MINTYVKSFNRPFYLDRCLGSLQRLVSGGKIIVLDDGTLTKYRAKIESLYPHVEFRYSQQTDKKYELVRAGEYNEIASQFVPPHRFWIAETENDPNEYLNVVEDDMWMVGNIDLDRWARIMEEHHTVCARYGWRKDDEFASIVIRDKVLDGGGSLSIFTDHTSLWQIWYPCSAVLSKEYWISGLSVMTHVNDEGSQLAQSHKFYCNHPVTFAHTDSRRMYQGWATPARSDPQYRKTGLEEYHFIDALNDAWLEDRLDWMEGYPHDFSDEYLLSVFVGKVPQVQIDLWKSFRSGNHKISDWTRYYNSEGI